MFNKLLTRLGFAQKESRAYSALIQLGLDQAVWTPRDYEHLTRVSYQLNADVYACVNLIARSAKQIPWIVYNKEGGTEVGNNHPLLKLLRRPNERDTESDFKEASLAYLLLSGNSYIERNGGEEGTPPAFLYPHRPDRFRVIKGNRRLMVSGYLYTYGADPVRFEEWEILHLRLFNPLDDYYGMSPVEAAAYTIDNSNEAASLYKKLLQKGYPPGAVSIKGVDYTDTQLRDLKVGLRRAVEQGDILLLQDATWQEMGFKPVDASIFQGKLSQKRDIAAIFGVPSGMIGDTQVKTYANSREERRSLYTEAVIPALTKLRDGLNNWLGPVFDGAFVDIDKDAIDALAEDREVQSKRVSLLWTTNVIKRNEARGELKYDAVPDEEDGYFSEVSKPAGSDPLLDGRPDPGDRQDPTALPPDRQRAPIPIRRENPGSNHQFKAFNLLSEEQKDSHWKLVDARRELWYARIAADVEERFSIERNAVLKAYRDTGETAALRAVTRQEDAWTKLYSNTVMAVAEDFGRRTAQSIKSDGYEYEVKFVQDLFTRTILEWLATEGAKRVVGVLDTTKQAIRKELAAGVVAGEGAFELTKRLEAMYGDFGTIRAERIARTEVQTAAAIGSQTAAKATNLPLIKEWISTRDDRVRDSHDSSNGQKRPMDEPYIVGGYRMMHPCDSTMGAPASEIIQCFPYNTPVVAFDIQRAYRRYFEGDLVEITDSLGNKLSGTPNHPILTTRGWLPLQALQQGDQIINCRFGNDTATGSGDVQTKPSTIGQVYDSLAQSGDLVGQAGHVVDFHGDGTNGDVDVVLADSLLLEERNVAIGKHLAELPLSSANFAQGSLVSNRLSNEGAIATLAASARSVGSTRKASTLFGTGLTHSHEHGSAATTLFDSSYSQQSSSNASGDAKAGGNSLFRLSNLVSADDLPLELSVALSATSGYSRTQRTSLNATSSEPPLNRSNRTREVSSDIAIAQSGSIQITNVVDVRLRAFSGHVYNLSTRSNWYVSNDFITHNCRCSEVYTLARG